MDATQDDVDISPLAHSPDPPKPSVATAAVKSSARHQSPTLSQSLPKGTTQSFTLHALVATISKGGCIMELIIKPETIALQNSKFNNMALEWGSPPHGDNDICQGDGLQRQPHMHLHSRGILLREHNAMCHNGHFQQQPHTCLHPMGNHYHAPISTLPFSHVRRH